MVIKNVACKFSFIIFLFFLMIDPAKAFSFNGKKDNLVPSEIPSLISCLRIKNPIYFCGEQVPFDNFDVRERLEKGDFFIRDIIQKGKILYERSGKRSDN